MTEAAAQTETEVQIDERIESLLSHLDHVVLDYATVKAEFLTRLDNRDPLIALEWGVGPLVTAAARANIYGGFASDIRYSLEQAEPEGYEDILAFMRESLTSSVMSGAAEHGRSTNDTDMEIRRAKLRFQAELLQTVNRLIAREEKKAG